MKRSLIPTFLLVLMATGCATNISSKDAKPVPKDRLLAYQIPDEKRTYPLSVTRDEGFLGGGCYLELWIESIKVAQFDTGETATFYVEPFVQTAGVNYDQEGKGLCSLAMNRPFYYEIVSVGRKTKPAYHIGIRGNSPAMGMGN
ncbi:hypothetical protein [Polynucleobacter arcticus]|uniref:hypothetical protein n=1 Tax=Polynucleobacter arcticus TaxID=1743165 RepID=UPI00156E2C4B|nr:hypothetical protein [Polynucleobacter arcticus]